MLELVLRPAWYMPLLQYTAYASSGAPIYLFPRHYDKMLVRIKPGHTDSPSLELRKQNDHSHPRTTAQAFRCDIHTDSCK